MESEVYESVRNSVAAIGFAADPRNLMIVGTGFLVSPTTLVTNRHVIKMVEGDGQSDGETQVEMSRANMWTQFVYADAEGNGWHRTSCKVTGAGYVSEEEFDIGVLDIDRGSEEGLSVCQPVTFAAERGEVGDPVAALGYPYGSALMQGGTGLRRFGPVLQQGFISAQAPFGGATVVNELLLDMRAAPGMSGSPIFRPHDGHVMGLLHAQVGETLCFALPLSDESLGHLLAARERWHAARPAI